MTEQEAKTKWCPFARVLDWAVEAPSMREPAQMMFAATNRYLAPNNDMPTCIGSACMAFRWDDYEQTDGYCGLAGRPPSGPNFVGRP